MLEKSIQEIENKMSLWFVQVGQETNKRRDQSMTEINEDKLSSLPLQPLYSCIFCAATSDQRQLKQLLVLQHSDVQLRMINNSHLFVRVKNTMK